MNQVTRIPAFQWQFEEIARLEEDIRLGKLNSEQAAQALRRIYEIMNWHGSETSTQTIAQSA